MKKRLIISANLIISLGLASRGMYGMLKRDPLLGGGYEFSTLMWIVGLVTLFLIPLEICVLKSSEKNK